MRISLGMQSCSEQRSSVAASLVPNILARDRRLS